MSSRTQKVFLRLASLSLLMCVLAAAEPRPAAAVEIRRIGTPVLGSVGVRQTTAEIMAAAATEIESEPILIPDHEGPDRSHLRPNPLSPRVASIPQMPPDLLVGNGSSKVGMPPLTPQVVGVNFLAATLSGGSFNTGAFPPDNDGAVGPTQYIICVNGRIVSFNKTTGASDGALNVSTNTFFNSVRNLSGTSDPQIRYDRLSGRWFVSIINVSTPNRWLLAVSDAASNGTITGSTVWTYYFFVPATISPAISNGTTCLSDYPSLGVDNSALYMGVNEFCGTGQPFQQEDVFVIRKSSVLSGGPIAVTAFRAVMSAPSVGGTYDGIYSARGVDNPDPGSSEGYFIGVDGNAYGLLDILRVANPGGAPSISGNIGLTVPMTSQPLTVPHLGNTGGANGQLDALDDRLFQASIRNGHIWTAQNIKVDNTGVVNATDANNTRDGSRWYEIAVPPGSGAPSIVQSGIVFTPTADNLTSERYYWVPSITVSGQGHAAMGFSTAGTNERVNAATVGRLAGDPLGTMQTPVLFTASSTAYNPTGDSGASRGARRWGDYTITCLDPIDDMSMWTVQQYCSSSNIYGCRVARLIAPPPATPSTLADIVAGQSSVSVTLTGTTASGSSFYDPGSDLPGVPAFSHLTAAITTGGASGTPPTVVSATYLDPTTIQLLLNASAATANVGSEKYTITITNPDGQSQAAAVIHVIPGSFTVTATAGAGGSISPSGGVSVPNGGSQPFTISAGACHAIADVKVDGVSVGAVTSYTFMNVQANHTIDASFAALGPFTVAASAGAGGSISPSGNASVACGGSQTFNILAADACHAIADVKVDGVSVGAVASYSFNNVQANHTIDASFAALGPFTVAASAGAGGSISPSGNAGVACGGSQSFTIANDACHSIADVKVDGVSVGAVTSYTFTDVRTGHTIDASFAALGGFTIDASAGAGGSISPSGSASVDCGASQKFDIVAADACHAIADVKVDGVSIGVVSSYTFTDVHAHHTIEAGFTALGPFSLVPSAGAGGSISPPDSVSVTCDGSQQFDITADAGFSIQDVLVDNASVGAVPSYAFANVHARHTIDASFAPIAAVSVPVKELALRSAPNPSSGAVRVDYDLPRTTRVGLAVLDIQGRVVAVLAQGTRDPGRYHAVWNGRTGRGAAPAGLYLIRLQAGSRTLIHRVVLTH